MEIVEIVKALSDATRLRILNLLNRETLCVCDLEAVLQISQSNASRHLTKLRQARLISSEKQAQWVYYRLDEACMAKYFFVRELLDRELVKEPACKADTDRLKIYRAMGGCCDRIVIIPD